MPRLKLSQRLPDFQGHHLEATTLDAATTLPNVQHSGAQTVTLNKGGAAPPNPSVNLEATTDHNGCPVWVRTR